MLSCQSNIAGTPNLSFLKGPAGDRKDFKDLLQTSCVEISPSLRISVQSLPIIHTPPGRKWRSAFESTAYRNASMLFPHLRNTWENGQWTCYCGSKHVSVFAVILQAQLDAKSEAAPLRPRARVWSCSREEEPWHMPSQKQDQAVGRFPADIQPKPFWWWGPKYLSSSQKENKMVQSCKVRCCLKPLYVGI